jgi:hypothetical protein
MDFLVTIIPLANDDYVALTVEMKAKLIRPLAILLSKIDIQHVNFINIFGCTIKNGF